MKAMQMSNKHQTKIKDLQDTEIIFKSNRSSFNINVKEWIIILMRQINYYVMLILLNYPQIICKLLSINIILHWSIWLKS